MIDIRNMTDAELRKIAMDAVIREIGNAGLTRVLRDLVPGNGNYIIDRETWLPKFENVEDMMETIAREGAPEKRQ